MLLLMYLIQNYQHIKGTTQSSHRTFGGAHIQMMVVTGSGVLYLSLISVSSQSGHQVTVRTEGVEFEYSITCHTAVGPTHHVIA